FIVFLSLVICFVMATGSFAETKFLTIGQEAQKVTTTWVHGLDNYITAKDVHIANIDGYYYCSAIFDNISNVRIESVDLQLKVYDISGARLMAVGNNTWYPDYEYDASTKILTDSIEPNSTLEISGKQIGISGFETASGKTTKPGRVEIAVSKIQTADGQIYRVQEEGWTWYSSDGSIKRGNPVADLPRSITDEMENDFLALNTGITSGAKIYDYIAEVYGYSEGGCIVSADNGSIIADEFGIDFVDVIVQVGPYRIRSYEDLVYAFLMLKDENNFSIVFYDRKTGKKQESSGRIMDDDAVIEKLQRERGSTFNHKLLEGLDGYSANGNSWEYSANMDMEYDWKEHYLTIKVSVGSENIVPKFYIECIDQDPFQWAGINIKTKGEVYSFSDLIKENNGVYMLCGNRSRDLFSQIKDAHELTLEIVLATGYTKSFDIDVYNSYNEPEECFASINNWAQVLEASGYWNQFSKADLSRVEMCYLSDSEHINILQDMNIPSFDSALLEGLSGSTIYEDGWTYMDFVHSDSSLNPTIAFSVSGMTSPEMTFWSDHENSSITACIMEVGENSFVFRNLETEVDLEATGTLKIGATALEILDTITNSPTGVVLKIYYEDEFCVSALFGQNDLANLINWYKALKATKYWEQWSDKELAKIDEQYQLVDPHYLEKLKASEVFMPDMLGDAEGYVNYGEGLWDYSATISYTYENGDTMFFMPRVGDDLDKPHIFFGTTPLWDFDSVKFVINDNDEYIFTNLEDAAGNKYIICGNQAKEMFERFKTASKVEVRYYCKSDETMFCNLIHNEILIGYQDILKWVEIIDASGLWENISENDLKAYDDLYCLDYPGKEELQARITTSKAVIDATKQNRITTSNANSDNSGSESEQTEITLTETDPSLFFTIQNGDDTITIAGYQGVESAIVIPKKIDGKEVTIIGESAFQGNNTIESVIIPVGVTEIQTWAFKGCTNLKEVSLPEGIVTIGAWAFDNCTSLTKADLPSTVKTVDGWAFQNCTS
ncbi:MAG: leucine-rich repeat domain-containing protein, partial [Firmicutes bacterium]|nr:leucine-rich repeat domain-containing protein [Bacillota bacterium]